MGVLEQVEKMRNEGKKDNEIALDLKKQNPRISPKEIQDAFNHLDIKTAVGNTSDDPPAGASDNPGNGQMQPPSPGDVPSLDGQQDTYSPPAQQNSYRQNEQSYSQGGYGQNNYGQSYDQQNYGQGGYDQNGQSYEQGGQQDYSQQQYQGGYDQSGQSYGQGSYDQGGQGYGPAPQESNSDTIVEISEQVFEEKSKSMAKKLDAFEEFRALSQSKLDQLSERLKKIESIIDRLQAAILERIGSYGRDIGSIKKEMSMMQDTFSRAAGRHASSAPQKRTERKSETSNSEKGKKSSKK